MNNELQIFKNEELGEVRVITKGEEILFVAKDLAFALGYSNVSDAIKSHVDAEDKVFLDSKTQSDITTELNYRELGQRGGWLINESGMYALIFGSDLDSAKRFKKWVTSEVLPSIRKYGAYISEDEESVDKDYIKYTYGQLKETFSKCHIEDLKEEYDKCIQWYKGEKFRLPYANNSKRRKGSKHTVTETREIVMSKISLVLESRSLTLKEDGRFGLSSEIDNIIKIIKDERRELNNRVNGGRLAGATKKIKELEKALS